MLGALYCRCVSCSVLVTPDLRFTSKLYRRVFKLLKRKKKDFSSTSTSTVGLQVSITLKEDTLQTGHKRRLSVRHMEAISFHVASLKPASASLGLGMFTRGGLWIWKCHLISPDVYTVSMPPKDFVAYCSVWVHVNRPRIFVWNKVKSTLMIFFWWKAAVETHIYGEGWWLHFRGRRYHCGIGLRPGGTDTAL